MERIRKTVRANGRFSQWSGIVLLVGATGLDGALGLDGWFLAAAGAALIGYGALIWWLGGRRNVISGARFATVMDLAWVAGAAVILLGFPGAMTTAGRVALAVVSLVVAGFAVLQLLAMRRSSVLETAASGP